MTLENLDHSRKEALLSCSSWPISAATKEQTNPISRRKLPNNWSLKKGHLTDFCSHSLFSQIDGQFVMGTSAIRSFVSLENILCPVFWWRTFAAADGEVPSSFLLYVRRNELGILWGKGFLTMIQRQLWIKAISKSSFAHLSILLMRLVVVKKVMVKPQKWPLFFGKKNLT